MTQLVEVEEQRRDQIIMEAADRGTQVVLSHRLDDGWTTHKSQILQVDSQGRYFVLEQPAHTPDEPPPEFAPGEQVGMAFRRGHKKCMCSVEISRLLQVENLEGQMVAALEVPWPTHLQEMQRRLYYRVAVPAGRRIEVMLWDGAIADLEPSDLKQRPSHTGLLQDLSAGGCRVIFEDHRCPPLSPGDTVGIQFQADPRSEPIVIDAMFRHREEVAARRCSLGFQFAGLELSAEGRGTLQLLCRVVSAFVRIDMRRKKMRVQRPQRRRR